MEGYFRIFHNVAWTKWHTAGCSPVLFILRPFYCATCHIHPNKRQTKRLKTFQNMLEASEVALKLARVNML